MGLIRAAVGAVGSTLHDQWKEYIKCDDLGNNILMRKVSTLNGIITKDSAIQVAPGQMAIIYENGKILDATAEAGIYTFDQSSSPSFFAGQFGDVFKEMWNRFKRVNYFVDDLTWGEVSETIVEEIPIVLEDFLLKKFNI